MSAPEEWITVAAATAEISKATSEPAGLASATLEHALEAGVRKRARAGLFAGSATWAGGATWPDIEYDPQFAEIEANDLRFWLSRHAPSRPRAPNRKRDEVAQFIAKNYPNGAAGKTRKEIAREIKGSLGITVSERTIGRALGKR